MKVTEYTSHRAGDRDEHYYAKSSFWQFELAKAAFSKHVYGPKAPYGLTDLRGREFTIRVSQDGLHVTVEEAT